MFSCFYAFEKRYGVTTDRKKAAELGAQAFQVLSNCVDIEEYPTAAVALGLLNSNAIGCLHLPKPALNLFTKAYKAGYVCGNLYLGLMYNHGSGVKKNLHEAIRQYSAAGLYSPLPFSLTNA